MEEEHLRFALQQERSSVRELHSAIRTERQKSLEWMEKHNRERDSRHLLQAEMEEVGHRLELLQKRAGRDAEERDQLTALYESERSQCRMLEEALR